MSRGERDFSDRATWARAQEADVVSDFVEAGCDGVELPMGFDKSVFSCLGFEVIFGFNELDAAFFCDEGNGLFWELGVTIQSSANCRASEREFVEGLESFVGTIEGAFHLFGEAGEFLTEANGGGVHHVGSANFENSVELMCLLSEGLVKPFEGRDEEVLEGDSSSDVHRCGKGVVRGLALVDVVVGMDTTIRSDLFSTVGDDLVGIHIGRGARAGLVGVDGEVLVVLTFKDFARGFFDNRGFFSVDDSKFTIGASGSELDETISVHN